MVLAVDFSAVDKYALGAPKVKTKEDMKELATYLTAPYHNDVEKARSIYAWVMYNVDYDTYKAKLKEDPRLTERLEKLSSEPIIKTRVGTSEDIANLYQELSAMAGLNTQTVSGWIKVDETLKKKKPRRHYWLAIKIANSWHFMDPAWEIENVERSSFYDVQGNGRYESEIKKRLRNKKTYEPRRSRRVGSWFMIRSADMIRTHFPELEEWQLHENKITKDEFFSAKSNRKKQK